MGLAPGGLMRQEVYEDKYGFDAWDTSSMSRCFVHILNSVAFFNVTGEAPPQEPPTAREYTASGLPWFDYYDADRTALEGAKKLAGLESVGTIRKRRRAKPLRGEESVPPALVRRIGGPRVRVGAF